MKYKTTAEVYFEKHGVPMPAVKGHTTEAVKSREKARQARIKVSPQSREASFADVESHDESMSRLNLHARWGA